MPNTKVTVPSDIWDGVKYACKCGWESTSGIQAVMHLGLAESLGKQAEHGPKEPQKEDIMKHRR